MPGTQPEPARTSALERRFSGSSSRRAEPKDYTQLETALAPRERLREAQRDRVRVRERGVRHHGYDDPAFGKRDQRRRAADEVFAVMADLPRGLAREMTSVSDPAEAIPGLCAGSQPLRCLQHLEGGGLSSLSR